MATVPISISDTSRLFYKVRSRPNLKYQAFELMHNVIQIRTVADESVKTFSTVYECILCIARNFLKF